MALGFDLERDDDGDDDRDGLLLCCRAIFFAWVKKLLALPSFGASDRTRPGFGRKRISSSALMGAARAEIYGDPAFGGHGAGQKPTAPKC
ncbi:hypothetical protein [Sphingomonas sanguinis]|uniref:hypothetical protein n=1 Tax=Sphingomonas sanguinis TaxID=33051 RepID=UPI000B1DF1AB|nr:hypothetical protein [Sphingomonas sanguinis]